MACEPLNGTAGDVVRGKAVLALRGSCVFSQKAASLSLAGALAVVLYNSEPHGAYFYPTQPEGTPAPSIPIFMISLEDGEAWKHWLANPSRSSNFSVRTTHCRTDGLEALPDATVDSTNNSSAAYLAQETWEAISDRLGCAHWAADPSGRFLHSGNNLHYHWLKSMLVLSVRFVCDGFLRFLYVVEAEDEYDGLSFLMDHEVQFQLQSKQAPQGEVRVNAPRGSHTFTWMYSKDWGGSIGADRARLFLLELVGTSYADSSCRSCARVSDRGAHGSEACHGCNSSEYIDATGECKQCPAGSRAPRGGVGKGSCKRMRPCTQDDIEVTYTAFEIDRGGIRRQLPGDECHRNRTLTSWAWRSPQSCDPASSGSVHLPEERENVTACPPCQHAEWRPTGGACLPFVPTCPDGLHAAREYRVSHWSSWPRNISHEVLGSARSHGTLHAPSGWQLAGDASAAVVGSWHMGLQEAHAALLHMDLALEGPSNLTAHLELRPSSAWGRQAGLLVNGSQVAGLRLEGLGASLFRVATELPRGLHRVTWSWSFAEGASLSSGDPSEGSLRLLNVSLPGALGAGASACAPCAEGQGAEGGLCRRCPAGRAGSGECRLCASGSAAGEGSRACRPCGPGMQSGEGAAFCEPMAQLSVQNFVGGSSGRYWDSRALLAAWAEASGNASGLRAMRVEDRFYYFGLFAPLEGPGRGGRGPTGGSACRPGPGPQRRARPALLASERWVTLWSPSRPCGTGSSSASGPRTPALARALDAPRGSFSVASRRRASSASSRRSSSQGPRCSARPPRCSGAPSWAPRRSRRPQRAARTSRSSGDLLQRARRALRPTLSRSRSASV